jgi:alkylhydroperoxidase family enzyme
MVGCPFWIDIHSAVGRKEGVTEGQLQDLAHFDSSAHFNQREKLVLRLTVALTRLPADVSDELFAALRAEFSEREMAELSAVICWENARARFNRTFDVGAEDFSKGKFCPLPERG